MSGRQHPPEVRERALAMMGNGQSQASVARELKVDRSTIRAWLAPRPRQDHQEGPGSTIDALLPSGVLLTGAAQDVAQALRAMGVGR